VRSNLNNAYKRLPVRMARWRPPPRPSRPPRPPAPGCLHTVH